MVLVVLGIKRGWWRSIHDTPLCATSIGNIARATAAEPGAHEAPEDEGDRPVAHSNRDIEMLKSKCKNMLHYAAVVLGNPVVHRQCLIIVEVLKPFREAFGKSMVRTKSAEGVLGHNMDVAQLSYNKCLASTVAKLSDPDALHTMRFFVSEDGAEKDFGLSDERFFAQLVLDLVRGLLRSRVFSMKNHSHNLPGVFALLLHPQPGVVQETLGRLKVIFGALEKVALVWDMGGGGALLVGRALL